MMNILCRWSESDARHDREVHYETIERMRRLGMDRREYALIKALVTCDPGEKKQNFLHLTVRNERVRL